ncbi:MAG TPA: MotA/TolQ/ExbB proton channel family protein [Thermoguttaceae bacterium]|nr:MotA/TolQ/ExbB proton channel family protein [Thermoguttaceae bacterium]
MNASSNPRRRAVFWFAILCVPLMLTAWSEVVVPQQAAAQQPGLQPPPPPDPGEDPAPAPGGAEGGPSAEVDDAAAGTGGGSTTDSSTEEEAGKEESDVAKKIGYLELLAAGGFMMWPIGALSLLVVTFGIERALGLRRHKVLPPELVSGLGNLAGKKGGLDPRQAYKLCQQFPSAAANVIKTMLLKVGRPHSELEHAVTEANDREAARLYANVRWLGLGAGIAPLLGLLGTVLGMISAFIATAEMTAGQSKSKALAEGIYEALVTTAAGLAVAIPAAVLAHWFEGRIQGLFRELDETLLGMMPQLERFEGRMRVTKDPLDARAGSRDRGHADDSPLAQEATPTAATPK